MSAAFGFDASTPYIRDSGEYTAKCQNKFSLTPKGDKIFYDCTSTDAQDGSLCAYNQQKGSCKDSVCQLPGIPRHLHLPCIDLPLTTGPSGHSKISNQVDCACFHFVPDP